MDDSFRGTCINCGTPTPPGAPCRNCQAALERRIAPPIFTRISYSEPNKKEIARIPDSMANVQVCERCGSIGQAKDFLSLSAFDMGGNTLILPQLITRRQFEKGIDESEEEDEPTPQTNFTLCRNCKAALRAFFENKPTQSGEAGPIVPRLPVPKSSDTSDQQAQSPS